MLFFCSVKLRHLKKEGGGGDVGEEKSGHCGIWELVRRRGEGGEEEERRYREEGRKDGGKEREEKRRESEW